MISRVMKHLVARGNLAVTPTGIVIRKIPDDGNVTCVATCEPHSSSRAVVALSTKLTTERNTIKRRNIQK
jgi:hypothetical protein